MQFTLQTLLLSFVVVASALAVFEGWGLVIAAVILIAVAYIRSNEAPGHAAVHVLVLCLFFGVPWVCSGLFQRGHHDEHIRCANRMHDVVFALNMYHDKHGHYPPAYVLGPDGKMWHSWRTLILPYLNRRDLYKQYRFDEPWDGPNNRKLAALDIPEYICRSDEHHVAGQTNYVAVIGPETLWPGVTPASLSDLAVHNHNSILLVEASGLGVAWSEPRDIALAEACDDSWSSPTISRESHSTPHSFFCRPAWGTIVATADGNTQLVPAETPAETWRALLTGDATFDPHWPRLAARPHWGHIGGLICLVLSTLLLLLRPIRRSNTSATLADTRAGGG